MPLRLYPEEPAAGPWRLEPLTDVVHRLMQPSPGDPSPSERTEPFIIAVDGRSAGGKTSLAARLASAIPGAEVVHTDDLAWHHSFFGWTELLTEGVLEPLRAGQRVAYRPPAWDVRSRPGAVTVEQPCRCLIVEGVGAARRALTPELDRIVWVQSDVVDARERGVARDSVKEGLEAATAFWDEWEGEERPFLAEERPWMRANAVVLGTPERAGFRGVPEDSVVVATRPGDDLKKET